MEMTNEQAAEIIKKYDVLGCGYCHQGGKEIEEAFNMAIKALQEQAEKPHQTDIDDAWEQAKAKYSLCNRCTKQPNCDDGKRNLYMNECSRFVDVVDMPQSDSNEFYNMDAPLRKQMREPTTEELETFDNYIKSISKPTGVNFWDLADGEKTCGTCRNEDTYHCAECENKSDYEQAQADGDLISRQMVMDCYKKWQPYMATRLHEFEKELSELPSVAIPNKVGHCIDCKYFRILPLHSGMKGRCIHHGGFCPNSDWYCADFEPQESEEV